MNEGIFLLQAILLLGVSRLFVKGGEIALTLWFVVLCLAANLFVSKEIILFSLPTTAADGYVVGAFFSLTYLQASFGKETAKKAIYWAFALQIAFLLLVQIHLFYVPSPLDRVQEAFEVVFAVYPRIIAASLTAFYLSQRFDVFAFGYIGGRFPSVPFRWRVFMSMAMSQTLDTLLFSVLALLGHMSDIRGVIAVSLTLKGLLLLVSLFFTEKDHVNPVRTSS